MVTTAERYNFKTEVHQLLDLVIHSLYSHRDIFLRELISNASDAIDKIRFDSLKDQTLLGTDTEFKIKIVRDDKNNTLTISDNGIGMTKTELIEHLGTIARSGTKEFIEKIKASKESLELIGQFGVGFYSAYMVADKIIVDTRTASGETHRWVSGGADGFELEASAKKTRGTDIILHLKKECSEYLEEYKLRELIRKYSDFVEYPIVMDIEREEQPKDAAGKEIEKAKPLKTIKEETINSRKAIWAKPKKDVTPVEYADFYKHLSHDYQDPLESIHFSAEGKTEFKALLYIPSKAPFDLFTRDAQRGIHLYIKRIFIMSDCKKILPEYLRFISGVVDSSDLPLNVSREILQEDAELDKIKSNIVKKILSTLKTMKEKEAEKYLKFYREFGAVLKEGLHYDWENKEALTELLLFESTKTKPGEYRSLDEYVQGMPGEQKEIYYCLGENRQVCAGSPHLEIFKNKQYEVLFFLDAVDEWIVPQILEYKKKKLKSITDRNLDLGDQKELKETQKKASTDYKELVDYLKKKFENKIQDVQFSARLTDSPCCLVNNEQAMSEQMLRMYKMMGQDMPEQKKILELNPQHPLISALQKMAQQAPAELDEYAELLFGQAIIAEGGKLENPLEFVQKLSKLITKAIS